MTGIGPIARRLPHSGVGVRVLAALAAAIVLLIAAGGCTRPAPRLLTATPPPSPELAALEAEERAFLDDARFTLGSFEAYQEARKVSAAGSSRCPPPAAEAWERATALARQAGPRASDLYLRVSGSQPNEALWRERRALAATAGRLVELGGALVAAGQSAPGAPDDPNGPAALADMGRAWNRWEAAGAQFGLTPGEVPHCGSALGSDAARGASLLGPT